MCTRVRVWSGEAFDTHAPPPIRMKHSSRDVFMNERATGRTETRGAAIVVVVGRRGEDGARAGSSDG